MIDVSDIKITPIMLNIISEIDEYKNSWNFNASVLNKKHLNQLKVVSALESIGSSNRIEGNSLSDAEIKTILLNLKEQSFRTRDEEEVAGYAELLDIIYKNHSIIPLNENYIKQLHKIMLSGVSKDISHCGEYKKISNAVAAFADNGQQIGVVFQTATPFDTPRLMADLVNWTKYAFEQHLLHPLLIIGIFVVNFLAIHPFQDGNGRLSRALTTLLLLKSGYSYVLYSSVESVIEASKSAYYAALRNTQKTICDDKVDYEPWLLFFLMTLQKQKNHLSDKIDFLKNRKNLSENAEAVLALFDKKNRWTIDELSRATGKATGTLRKIIQNLCKQRYITKFGITKSAFYKKIS